MSVASYYSCCLWLFFMQMEDSIGNIWHGSLGLEGRYSRAIKASKTKAAWWLASQPNKMNS